MKTLLVVAIVYFATGCATYSGVLASNHRPAADINLEIPEDSEMMREIRLYHLTEAAAVLRNERSNPGFLEEYFCRVGRTFSSKLEIPDQVRVAVNETPNLGRRKELAAYFLVKKFGEYAVCGLEEPGQNTKKIVKLAKDLIVRMGPIPAYNLTEDAPFEAVGYRFR